MRTRSEATIIIAASLVQHAVIVLIANSLQRQQQQVLVNILAGFVTIYWLVGFHGNFFLMALILWLMAMASSSLGVLLGCSTSNTDQAAQVSERSKRKNKAAQARLASKSTSWAAFVVKLTISHNFNRFAHALFSWHCGHLGAAVSTHRRSPDPLHRDLPLDRRDSELDPLDPIPLPAKIRGQLDVHRRVPTRQVHVRVFRRRQRLHQCGARKLPAHSRLNRRPTRKKRNVRRDFDCALCAVPSWRVNVAEE